MKLTPLLCAAGICLVVATPQIARAQQPGGPPPAAFEACESAAANATCSFQAPRGVVEGTCRNIKNSMVCAPARQPGGAGGSETGGGQSTGQAGGQGGGGPPPAEAFEACQGNSAKAACSFQGRQGSVEGTCRNIDGGLVCAPANPPGGAGG